MDNLNTHQSREQKEKKIQEIEDEKWSWKKTNELSKRQTKHRKKEKEQKKVKNRLLQKFKTTWKFQ